MEYMPNMAYGPRLAAQHEDPMNPGYSINRNPVPGTVPRGFLPFRYQRTAEDATRAGQELLDPAPGTPERRARGKVLYETFCLVCHGQNGEGDGPLVPRIPNPPSYSSERVRAFPPGQVYHVITLGTGRMPGYASQISPEQRWLIVGYVQILQGNGGAP